MKEQTKKQKERAKRWDKRICIKSKQLQYVEKVRKKKGFKSKAGSLDYIINQYKKHDL